VFFLIQTNTLFGQQPVFNELENVAKPSTEEDITPIVDVLVLPDKGYSAIEVQGTQPNVPIVQSIGTKLNLPGNNGDANNLREANQEGDDFIDIDSKAEKFKLEVSLYPNPANNFVNIKLDSDTEYEIAIYDLTGNKIKQLRSALSTSLFRIDLIDMTTGVYFVQVACNNTQQTVILKVVK